MEVPTQSVPVSPPPNTTTSLPFAVMGVESGASASTAWVLTVRKSIAKCTPLRSRPSTLQIARQRGAGADDGGVEILDQQLRLDVLADVRIADELDAFLLHERDATRDHFALVELHVGNAVGEQAARAIGALEHGHRVAGLVELRGGREARRARSR